MATWIAHLRVAENILKKGYNFEQKAFIVGNIGPDYLDYFPKGAFEKQVKYITEFYLGENEESKDNFIYLTEDEMDEFVDKTTRIIDNLLRNV
ncbi:hypothetical protein [Haloimpatiens lingqiaonensis]|uniref:hypothetical protein n=1 Tax=Haloimpatiens lingqiaonensis TaxID=1380675 RepID=UPI0010FDCA04|nr:hypothetical protein [Haloimpatiens lingqiaonensis]